MKNSYYFPHDYFSRHDPKLERLRMKLGCEGVGVYWCLVEMLYEQGGTLELKDMEIYAKALNTSMETLLDTTSGYDLFLKNKTHFWSPTILKRLKHINAKRLKASTSAKLSHSANAERTLCGRPAIKKRKEEERKEEKRSKVATLSDEEFLKALKENPAYKNIDIDSELAKMDAYLLTKKGRLKTRRFIVAWLNRIDRPFIQSIKQPKGEDLMAKYKKYMEEADDRPAPLRP